ERDRAPMGQLQHLALALIALALLNASGSPSPTGSSAEREEYARYALTTRGDVTKGRVVFNDASRAACNRCHRVRGQGGDLGPDLSDIGAKFAREHLIESVLEPSRQI